MKTLFRPGFSLFFPAVILMACQAGCTEVENDEPVNIVFLFTDDQHGMRESLSRPLLGTGLS